MATGLTTEDRRQLDSAMRRHPAGRNLRNSSTGLATVIPFPRATIVPTATTAATIEKETEND